MKTARSRNGITIRLNDERWKHIAQDHPELNDRADDVLTTLIDPDSIWQGDAAELIAGKKFDGLYLLVVYREVTPRDGFVITAYLTRRPARRKLLWKR